MVSSYRRLDEPGGESVAVLPTSRRGMSSRTSTSSSICNIKVIGIVAIISLCALAIGLGVGLSNGPSPSPPGPSENASDTACLLLQCFGPVLAAVQLAPVFNDSITYVDMPVKQGALVYIYIYMCVYIFVY